MRTKYGSSSFELQSEDWGIGGHTLPSRLRERSQYTRDRFKAQVVPHSSVRFHRGSYLLRSYIPWSPQSAGEFGFVFPPVILRIRGDLCPNEMSRVTPVVEQNALFECLGSGRNYDDVMLAIGVGKRLGPVELKRLQLQCIQSDEKLCCPLETESSFSRSHVDEKVLNAG
jgi:hypothetical protein